MARSRKPRWAFAFVAVLLCSAASGCALPLIGARPDRADEAEHARGRGRVRFVHRAPNPTGERCYAALTSARIEFERVPREDARGVENPVRLRGPIHGVEVVAHGRRVHAILDCRLALALSSWAPALQRAGVVQIEHYSIYRPRARVGGGGRTSGHARGLAIDAARFKLQSGAVLDVLTDWEDRERGSSPCPRRPEEAWPSRLLRGVVCDAVASNLFQVVLTPHHDRAHENHVHLELKPEVNWTYVR